MLAWLSRGRSCIHQGTYKAEVLATFDRAYQTGMRRLFDSGFDRYSCAPG